MSEPFDSWAIVELLGRRRLVGRATEEERFGTKLGRIDVPEPPDPDCPACHGSGQVPASDVGEGEPEHPCEMCGSKFTTSYFGGSSIYSITPTTEQAARRIADQSRPRPMHQLEMPRQAQQRSLYDDPDDDYDDPDDEY